MKFHHDFHHQVAFSVARRSLMPTGISRVSHASLVPTNSCTLQAYINNLNKAMAGKDAVSLVSLMPGAKAAKLNNAGGARLAHA